MKIDGYNFFFHPLHEDHSTAVKALAVIMAVALTALSFGLYLFLFAVICCNEKEVKPLPSLPLPILLPLSSTTQLTQVTGKLQNLKDKQAKHLAKLEALPWEHLQTHTSHPDSGFDWWMFPIDRASAGQGSTYQVSASDIKILKNDAVFMQSYRKGVILVAKSWGWDLETGQDVTSATQYWTNYQVRLGKMLHSLILFGQDDLHGALVKFIDDAGIRHTLADWIQDYL